MSMSGVQDCDFSRSAYVVKAVAFCPLIRKTMIC
jgi:hypothetical protein